MALVWFISQSPMETSAHISQAAEEAVTFWPAPGPRALGHLNRVPRIHGW